MFKKLVVTILAVAFFSAGFSQQTKEEIQKKQQDLQRELSDLNNTLSKIKKSKTQSLGQLALVQRKIKAREELIRSINKELRRIDEEIDHNTEEISKYRRELDTLKQNYAKNLVFAYKNRSNYDYLNFIFSANTFNDALKRIAYLKSYKQYRETQVDNIVKTQELLQKKISSLASSKTEKSSTLKEQGQQLQKMEDDRKEKDQVVKELKGREKDIASEIADKEKTRRKLQQALQVIIRREIEEAKRKERERQEQLAKQAEEERKRKAAEQTAANQTNANRPAAKDEVAKNTPPPAAATTSAKPAPKTNRSYSPFESTEEGLTMSLNFENNKGQLPWPVSAGFVSIHFGTYEIPGTSLKGSSDGIDISLPAGSTVRSVADGQVSSVFDLGGEQTVVIRHGKYFTTYSHLSSVSISKNDNVKAGTVIGKSAADENGEGLLTFMVSNDKGGFLNPESWLKPR
ncbi:MAG: peptidoglycan DD-metalloendopeptidase family protein [Ilyomonas sp.]